MTPGDEWRGLDAGTRRAVQRNARHLQAHPDPRVSAVAARYARAALDGTRRWVRWLVIVVAVLACGIGAFSGVWSPRVSTGVITALVVMVIIVVPMLRVSLLSKMEMANKLALAPADGGAPASAEGTATTRRQEALAGQDLVVKYNRGQVLRLLGLLFGMGCFFLAYGLLMRTDTPERWFFWLSGALLIALAVTAAVRALLWGLLRPILTLDAGGVHLPRYGYTLPWAELAEVRLIPLPSPRRRRRRRPVAIVAFVPADPDAALREIRAKGGARQFEKSSRLYGTPLTLADSLMDQTADQIATAASAFAPTVPVSRY
jgi:hypothetical protein